ncbi:MAG: tRNA(Ile)-lysidine synthase, partial [Flaviaesturariibacter sp.]|nr:tRNA(Ile)-lysidine synthase [Flaviaesturariibacter sp.]
HCNFGLRGDESNRDEGFATSLAAQLQVPFHVKAFDTHSYANTKHISIQVAARELRYAWFSELLKEQNIPYLLTAHHADDNVETVLMNLVKGTGISGLTGIYPKRDKVIRPLLFASRKQLEEYAQEQRLEWVEDSSNAKSDYTRNYFRHEVIPVLEKGHPQARQNIAATVERLREVETLYNQSIALHKKTLLEPKGTEVHIPVLKLAKTVPLRSVLYEIIRDYGFTGLQVEEVVKLLTSENGRYIASSTHRIIRNRAWLIIAPSQTEDSNLILIEEGSTTASFAEGIISIKPVNSDTVSFEAGKETVFIDAAAITFPLLLRRPKAGDYFYPLGMRKKKKLSRFFIDAKLSKTEKEAVWVLESAKRIIWVVGHRIDDRFKLIPPSKKVLKLIFQKKS